MSGVVSVTASLDGTPTAVVVEPWVMEAMGVSALTMAGSEFPVTFNGASFTLLVSHVTVGASGNVTIHFGSSEAPA